MINELSFEVQTTTFICCKIQEIFAEVHWP